jgi:hypothetical protein
MEVLRLKNMTKIYIYNPNKLMNLLKYIQYITVYHHVNHCSES